VLPRESEDAPAARKGAAQIARLAMTSPWQNDVSPI